MDKRREESGTEADRDCGHILVVDDEPFIRNSFQLYLETLGFRVSTAWSGTEALRCTRDASPPVDVAILDLVMPGMHGIEVLRKLRESATAPEVIIATGCGNMNTAIQALRYGAFDYITKPIVDFDRDLLKVVRAALAARRKRVEDPTQAPGPPSNVPEQGVDRAVAVLSDLEKLASSLAAVVSPEDALASLGAFLASHGEAVGALLFVHFDGQEPHPLAGWGILENEPELALWVRAVSRRMEAPAMADGASTDGVLRLAAHELGLADRATALEAVILPFGTEEAAGVPRGGLLVLQRQGGIHGSPLPVPHLLSLVLERVALREAGTTCLPPSARRSDRGSRSGTRA
jgi:DNA-binding response OmpR family regulator